MCESRKKAVIIGAGPAGLTAAMELRKRTSVKPVIFEATDEIGGISRTVNYKGNRMDIGGHRFFSKNETVTRWWSEVMRRDKGDDRVMLVRDRVSRIFFLRNFFDYPITLSCKTFKNMGLMNTVCSGLDYLKARLFPRKEASLEDFYINRFGKRLYKLFFEDYTTKVWGKHPSALGADWGSQRVKGVSVTAVVKDFIQKKLGMKRSAGEVETSLIEEFFYPKYGPGQLWECVADDAVACGAELHKGHLVKRVYLKENKVERIDVVCPDGQIKKVDCDYLLSSMPIKELVAAMEGSVPQRVRDIASELPYRDFITVGLLVDKLKIKAKDGAGLIPDTWIYIQERDVRIGRLQIFNNWSPYLVADKENTVWLGLEYFCDEDDELWKMGKEELVCMAVGELVKIGMIEESAVLDAHHVKVKKAYPAYFGAYYELGEVRKFLDTIENLFCIGRNGQHRYNNMDHSMLTAMEAVKNIENGVADKENVWSVNTESEYHEAKSK